MDAKSESENTSLKVLPPWMIKKGMNLTKEQRGEVKDESKTDAGSASAQFSDDKKSLANDDDKTNIQVCSIRLALFISCEFKCFLILKSKLTEIL